MRWYRDRKHAESVCWASIGCEHFRVRDCGSGWCLPPTADSKILATSPAGLCSGHDNGDCSLVAPFSEVPKCMVRCGDCTHCSRNTAAPGVETQCGCCL